MSINDRQTLLRPQTHTLAIVSLVLSILGLLPVLPLVGSIGGIVTGMIARKEIRLHPELYLGDGIAKAGVILGWIGLVLAVLLALLLFSSLAIYSTSSSIQPGPIIQQITAQP